MQFRSERSIRAPVETVFGTIADATEYQKAIPAILSVEYLTEQQRGLGTIHRETREMQGKPMSVELEVTEFIEGEKIRFVTDMNGCVWDSTFAFRPSDAGTDLLLIMDALPHKFFAKVLNLLIKNIVQKGLDNDMDLVKKYCEQRTVDA